ncbi:putative reverse transcriptase domain-containing protein, partial [Tanacetum coccineum]
MAVLTESPTSPPSLHSSCKVYFPLLNAIENNDRRGCTYKEFLACNPKEYDGKGGAIVYTCWIEKMKSVQDMSGCRDSQKVKYTAVHFNEMQKLETELWNHAMVGAGHAAYTDRFHELARLVPHLVTPKGKRIKRYVYGLALQIQGIVAAMEPKTIQKAECDPVNARNPTARACFECGSTDHIKSACPRLNQAQRLGGNHQNQVVAVNGVQGCRNQGNQARGRAFMLGAEEARQAPNIVTGTFTLNDHYATTLFDSGADYSFVSTTFIPLLDIEPNDLGFSYEIEIASGQLVEIDKLLGGMDWMYTHKAEIICHEKVVRIPLPNGKVLRVIGERLDEKVRHLIDLRSGYHQLRCLRDEIPKNAFRTRLGISSSSMPPFGLTNTPATREEHEVHLRLALELLKKEKLYAKFSKCEFWLREVQFLRHVINRDGVDPSKIEVVKNWKAPRTPSEQENAFQTLKDKLCNALVLALPDGPEDFVVYYDASSLGLGCVLMQRGKRRWIELFSDYDCEIRYHPDKANVVANALSRKERVKPKRVKAINMTLQSRIKDRILAAQKEASDESAGLQKGLDKM